MTKRSLTTIRFEELLPAWESDPEFELCVVRYVAKNRSYCERMTRFLYPSVDPNEPIGIMYLRSFAERHCRAVLLWVHRYRLGKSHRWEVRSRTLGDALGGEFQLALYRWNAAQSTEAKAFIANWLRQLEKSATLKTAAGIRALALSYWLRSLISLSTFDHLVERLTRRVLAPGGQTALFAPLT